MKALSYSISAQLEKKLKNISELAASCRVHLETLSPECLDYIHRYARICNIGASTRIENAVLTDPEIDWMDATLGNDSRIGTFEKHKAAIENKLSKDKERSIEEVAGLRRVLSLVYDSGKGMFPLREIDVRSLHQELLQFYPAAHHYMGQYKIASNSVVEMLGGKIKKEIFRTADPGPMTNIAMQELFDWYNETLPDHLWSLAVICEFVYRFLAIHPFQDGNGRLSRTLFLLGMLHSPDKNLSFVSPYLALDRQVEKKREIYYIVLRQCSGGIFRQDPKEYQIERFLSFMLDRMEQSLKEDAAYYEGRYNAYLKLNDPAKNVLACFKEHPEVRLQSGEVSKLADMPRRTATRALDELVKAKFLLKMGVATGTHYQLLF